MKLHSTFWTGKKVLVTGHTGFKGSWLIALLNKLGATTAGLSLAPETDRPCLYGYGIRPNNRDVIGDIRDLVIVENLIKEFKPDIVFHLAAQALVLPSYEDPVGTFSTNVVGTANLMMACLKNPDLRVFVNITSDKCYENREWHWPYRENDPMGGHDPYSASKGCAELVAASFRNSFYNERNISLPSLRAGNVIGGGDWAKFRIVPDLMQSFSRKEAAVLRNPGAIRPWQHVLEPLRAYLMVAQKAWTEPKQTSQGWNIGPTDESAKPVLNLAQKAASIWGTGAEVKVVEQADKKHEANYLKLDSTLIRSQVGWRPLYDFDKTMQLTVDWYKRYYQGEPAKALCEEQATNCLRHDSELSAD